MLGARLAKGVIMPFGSWAQWCQNRLRAESKARGIPKGSRVGGKGRFQQQAQGQVAFRPSVKTKEAGNRQEIDVLAGGQSLQHLESLAVGWR